MNPSQYRAGSALIASSVAYRAGVSVSLKSRASPLPVGSSRSLMIRSMSLSQRMALCLYQNAMYNYSSNGYVKPIREIDLSTMPPVNMVVKPIGRTIISYFLMPTSRLYSPLGRWGSCTMVKFPRLQLVIPLSTSQSRIEFPCTKTTTDNQSLL